MQSRFKKRAFSGLASFAGTTVGRRVGSLVESLDRAFKNDGSDHRHNGEAWLLSRLAATPTPVLFDVGANVGEWSAEAADRLSEVTIHAFEPIPDTYELLLHRVGASPHVVAHNLALSSEDIGPMPMWIGRSSDTASAVRRPEGETREVVVEAITGDTFCSQEGVEHINLLKIDTEGHDLGVLRGFSQMIAAGEIDVIQFEFTLFAVFARTWLGDFYSLLEPHGYSVGKLFPHWIDWKDYDAHDEQFLRCNFVAARKGTAAGEALGL